MKSARVGNIDNVQYALDHGADINCSDGVSNTLYTLVPSVIIVIDVSVCKFSYSMTFHVIKSQWHYQLLANDTHVHVLVHKSIFTNHS